MAIFSANIENLRELYIDQLQHLYSVETQLTKALPKMADAATDPQLKKAFTTHLQETRNHMKGIEQILSRTDQSVDSKKSEAMETLISEGEDMIKDAKDNAVCDAGLILAAQRVEHYEIASYGAVRRYAEILGETEAAEMLNRIEEEEGNADQLLTDISQSANPRAHKAA